MDHSMMAHGGKKMSARDCTLECVKGGEKYVFVSKGKVYQVKNQDMKDLQVHAGHTVNLTGEMTPDGKTITVSKIVMPAGKK
jgi:tricorn protease-like protein